MLHLERCSTKLMREVFMPLERPPGRHVATARQLQDDRLVLQRDREGSSGSPARSCGSNAHPSCSTTRPTGTRTAAAGRRRVTDLPTALAAIETIVEQGEGAAPGNLEVPRRTGPPDTREQELSHYAKFERIAEDIDEIGEVWPVPKDPRAKHYEGPHRRCATLFDAAYCYLMRMLDTLYATPSTTVEEGRSPRYGLERTCIAAMGGLLYPLADLLVRQPAGPRRPRRPHVRVPPFPRRRTVQGPAARAVRRPAGRVPEPRGRQQRARLIGLLPSV